MVSLRTKTGLSRKIVAYHLCFCLAAVCWVAAALLLTTHALLCDRAANACLSQLGRTAAAIEMHWLRHGADGLQGVLAGLERSSRASYWSVVGVDGNILAHSQEKLAGQRAHEPIGARGRWGDATSIRYKRPDGSVVQEYRVELTAGAGPIGDLRVGVDEPSFMATVSAAAPFVPVAMLAPLVLVVAGGAVLSVLTRPITGIESRLRDMARKPADAPIGLERLRARDAASLGWNRIVEQLQRVAASGGAGDVAAVLEQAARTRADAQYEQILQRLSDGIAVTDAEGRIAFANRAVTALLGHEDGVESLSGLPLEQRLLQIVECPDDSDLLSPAAQRRTTVCELAQRGGESERVLRVARLPLDESANGHVWSLRDVTQQKLAEQTRDRFIDTATHELRTPLANIKAYAETLAGTEHIDIELQKEFCNIINSEVTRLARFIDDLLSISSMEVGALTIDRQKVETERLFAEVLSKVEPLMQQKQIDFQPELPPKMPEMLLDKDKIIAVVVNILGNAAKYTPDGGRVALRVKAEDGKLRVAVEDTGVGISADDLPKLFDKFFRSEDPRVQAETGTGLGLSLAREVIRMHGGEIIVESELNKGSVFTVLLPLT